MPFIRSNARRASGFWTCFRPPCGRRTGRCFPEFYAYIKAADKISAYTKCLEEQRSGNREFDQAARQLYDAVLSMHLPEADYFMEKFVPGFGLTLDELQAEEQ